MPVFFPLCFFTPVCRAHHHVHVSLFTSERQRREETVWILLCASDAGGWQDSARWHPRAHYPQGNNCMASLLRHRPSSVELNLKGMYTYWTVVGGKCKSFAPNGLILPLLKSTPTNSQLANFISDRQC